MLKRGAWEVPVAGSQSETLWNGFFSEGLWSYICSEGKNNEKNPHRPTYRRPYEGRRVICHHS